ncbi:SRPBCC family protein [Thaumasiovibrio sp. DFM-14]|uniref:SRPBCC family protein n=1 Tax=Thaumasiovibrio sp. DFM-14 TaxID=3384792 RepID=UPI0039A338B2
MPSYVATQSIEIEKAADKVLEFLSDFSTWPDWSPWLRLEPECEVTLTQPQKVEGAMYRWNGDLVGAGSVMLEERLADGLKLKLFFKEPYRSMACASFKVKDTRRGCRVEWEMRGHVPWYLFFLKRFFKAMVEMDFERGLRMLKSVLETGEIPSDLKFIGERPFAQTHYIGIHGGSTLAGIGPAMQGQITRLLEYVDLEQVPVNGELFCLYENMKMEDGFFDYVVCLPVSEPIVVSGELVCGTLPACDSYVVEHTGAYAFLGNAWAFIMLHIRHKKIKTKQKPLGLERYLNSPCDVSEAELKTEVVVFKR